MCNITIICLPTSLMYCCYTNLGNVGCSSKSLTGQDYTCMHKNWCRIFVRMNKPYFFNRGNTTDGCYYRDVVLMQQMLPCCFPLLVTWPIWSSSWLTHGTDCHRVSLMMLLMNGGRDLGPAWRKKEDISNICYNKWTWTHLVVQLNLLCFRLCHYALDSYLKVV